MVVRESVPDRRARAFLSRRPDLVLQAPACTPAPAAVPGAPACANPVMISSAQFVDLFHWLEALVLRAEGFLVTFVTSPSILNDYLKLGIVLTLTFLLEIAARKNWRVRYGSRN